VDQYREGKVKSTPTRGVKQFLKPDAYKQWELRGQEPGTGNREERFFPTPGSWSLAPE
jgi:hypothetical protein